MVVVMSPRQCLVFCNGSHLPQAAGQTQLRGGEPRDGYCWLETVGSRWVSGGHLLSLHHQSLT